jgi:hypothetical protein
MQSASLIALDDYPDSAKKLKLKLSSRDGREGP